MSAHPSSIARTRLVGADVLVDVRGLEASLLARATARARWPEYRAECEGVPWRGLEDPVRPMTARIGAYAEEIPCGGDMSGW